MQLQNHLDTLYQKHFLKDVQYRKQSWKIFYSCAKIYQSLPPNHQFYNELKILK